MDRRRRALESHADGFARFASREDYAGLILPAIERIQSLERARVVELGAGTGNLTAKLAPRCAALSACDFSLPMLTRALPLSRRASTPAALVAADSRQLPLARECADVVIAGWTLSYVVEWSPSRWRDELDLVFDEMARVLRPGGTILLLEPYRIGSSRPIPPNPRLGEYYESLIHERGFRQRVIRTDFQFKDADEARELTALVYGSGLSSALVPEGTITVRGHTGIFWRTDNDSSFSSG